MVDLERHGLPTILVTTTSFKGLAKMEAKAFGMPDVEILAVPHPVGTLPPDKVRLKAEDAMEALVKLMTGGAGKVAAGR